MAEYTFKSDPRINEFDRSKLREFCSSLERDIVSLARDFGLLVFREDLLPYERGYLENAPRSGSPTGWVIKINRSDRLATQNFTVAHEIGHFVLHKQSLVGRDVFDGRMKRDTDNGPDPFTYLQSEDKHLEREANRFASLLLMPPNLFKPAYERLDGSREALARLFLVSESAVERRTRELGLSK